MFLRNAWRDIFFKQDLTEDNVSAVGMGRSRTAAREEHLA